MRVLQRELFLQLQHTSATTGVFGDVDHFCDIGAAVVASTGHAAPRAVDCAVVTATTAVVTATAAGTAPTAPRITG